MSRPRLRRTLLLTAAAVPITIGSIGLTVPGSQATPITSAQGSVGPDGGDFADPTVADRPLYRFWTTGGLMTPETIDKQVKQIAASGAGGYEANMYAIRAWNVLGGDYNAALHSWGTPAWTASLQNLLDDGKDQGLRVDQIYTPGWSAGTMTVSPDGVGSAKEITFGQADVAAGATFTGALPTAALPAGVTQRTLQSAVAYQCASDCDGTTPVLDPTSAVDLTAQVVDGQLTWTAPGDPSGATWKLVASWMNGTGQSIVIATSPQTTYLVDHFAPQGFDAIKDYWNDHVMTPELKASMQASGGSMFMDSLELNRDGVQVRSWTPDFLREFQERRGYSLEPYIAAVAVSDPAFDFTGGFGERIREDYNQTLSDLFRDYHLKPMQEWAKSLGMTIRGQAYSSYGPSPVDFQEMATILDTPEGEDRSFNSGNDLDYIQLRSDDVWRAMTSAASQAGRNIVSTECCAEGAKFDYPRATLLAHVNQQFAMGVNQIVWHGWADQTSKFSTWPGNQPFSTADIYGPYVPTATDDKAINDYVGRMQTVLRRGQLRDDIAIYRQGDGHSLAGDTGDLYFTDQSLAKAGYTYGFMNSTLAADPAAVVKDGVLDADTLQYKAFVLNNTPNENYDTALDLSTAQKMLTWAQAGLPIVIVGDTPTRVRGNHPAQDAQLTAVLDQLTARPNVHQVATEADVLGVLEGAGVKPAVQPATSSPFLSLRRETSDANYYYLWNGSETRASETVTLHGEGTPFAYDAWTGQVHAIADYQRTADGVTLDVSAAAGTGQLIGITTGNADTVGVPVGTQHVTSTTADSVSYRDADSLLVRADEPGTYATTLSNGRTVKAAVTGFGTRSTLTDWKLDVTGYEQGATTAAADTRHVAVPTIDVTAAQDGTLPDWQNITGLAKRSGTATYTTLATVAEGSTHATLDLGDVRGTYSVEVNGQDVPRTDQMDPSAIDVSPFLRVGNNKIVVHLATLLGNAANNKTRSYGLVGPVQLTPYGETAVSITAPSTATVTAVKLQRSTFGFAQPTTARITVTSDDRSKVGGPVDVTVGGTTTRLTLVNGTAVYTFPSALKPGTYSVRVDYRGDGADLKSSTARSTVTVTRAKPVITAKVKRHKTSVRLRVHATFGNGSKVSPTGLVLVYDKNKVIASKTIRVADHGDVVIKLGRLARGTHRLRVTLTENDLHTAATSQVRRVVIRKG